MRSHKTRGSVNQNEVKLKKTGPLQGFHSKWESDLLIKARSSKPDYANPWLVEMLILIYLALKEYFSED